MSGCPQEQAPACGPDIHPSFRIADTARALNQPWNTDWQEQLSDLHGHLDAHCQKSGLTEADPARARYQIARGLFKAAVTPLMHHFEVKRAEHALPYIENGEPADFTVAGKIDNTVLDEFIGTGITPPNDSFYEAREQDAAWTLGATEGAIRAIEADENHGLRHAWEAFCAVLPEFGEAEMIQLNRREQRPYDARTAVARMGIENFEAILFTALPRALQINRVERVAGMALVKRLLAQSESLAWFSSVGRPFSKDKLINPPGCPYIERPVYNSAESSKVWALESLTNGPWLIRRSCAANVEMPGHTDADCQIIDRVYAAKEAWTGVASRIHPRQPGVTIAAELRLINTTYLLGRTIFAAPPFINR